MHRNWSKYLVALIVSLIATFAALPAQAQGAWKKLGERTVNGGKNTVDKDTIAVGADDGTFTAIQIKVENSSLEMYDINVVFDKGSFSPNTKLTFRPNETTRTIDLPGDKRIIKKVDFRYANLPGGGNARVELWGKSGSPAAGTEAAALAPGMKKLGQSTVNGKVDKDSIAVGADDGRFTAIQLKIEGSSLEMYDVNVVFDNGQQFSPNTRLVFAKDSYSRLIDLPGDARVIRRVEFKYGNLPGGGNARVELWGKPGAAPQPAFAKLGERTVNGKFDKDTIAVGADDGLFSAIQLKVENSSLEMYDVKVVFANGQSFSPNTKLVFRPNESTRLIDLPGEKRIIRRVEFKYGNLPGGGNARVELWGKR